MHPKPGASTNAHTFARVPRGWHCFSSFSAVDDHDMRRIVSRRLQRGEGEVSGNGVVHAPLGLPLRAALEGEGQVGAAAGRT